MCERVCVGGGRWKKESRHSAHTHTHTKHKKKMDMNGTTDAVAMPTPLHPSLPMDASSSSMPAYIFVVVVALQVLAGMGICWICYGICVTAISRGPRQRHCDGAISEDTTSAIKCANKV